MDETLKKTIFLAVALCLLTLHLAGCAPAPDAPSPQPTAAATTAAPSPPPPTATASPQPNLTPTNTPPPLSLFIAESVPPGIINRQPFSDRLTSEAAGATLWFGPGANAPPGEVLVSAAWVYALTAPFPTLTDDISLAALKSFWKTGQTEALAGLQSLSVPASLLLILEERWGQPAHGAVHSLSTNLDPESLWEQPGAWAIVPFENLDPRLKVIRIDGSSPLDETFAPETDPLTVPFRLVQIGKSPIPEAEVQTLREAIQSTNRDTAKMTTLVMTGVTALVRATAYRMEINGVHYPGEDIRPWLAEADLTHISNEVSFYADCPFPDPYSRSLFFCSDPSYIALLEYVGADIIELTGNHNNDAWFVYGVDVVPFSLDLYRQHDMVYFGGGKNLAEALSPALVSHNGNDLAFIGCNAHGPDYAWATPERGGSAPCSDYRWMAEEVTRLREAGYLPIVTFQYHENYSNIPGETQILHFGLMAEAGAVIVNGSQAHRPKGMAFHAGAFIDYGLGNLFFDQMGVTINGNLIEQTRWEIIQRHTFFDGRHLSTELLTAMLEDYARPRPMTPRERLRFLEELFSASDWD